MNFADALAECPLVAILRGVAPEEVGPIGDVLAQAGFRLIEVPLNSPRALASIAALARRLDGRALVGAGTVLNVQNVTDVAEAGGRFIVSPNVDSVVISETVRRGLASLPGYFTPTEAFVAIEAGADALKFFPAEAASPAALKAQLAVLPADIPVLAVGGIEAEAMAAWRAAGAKGFGIGSALYRPGMAPDEVAERAAAFIAAL